MIYVKFCGHSWNDLKKINFEAGDGLKCSRCLNRVKIKGDCTHSSSFFVFLEGVASDKISSSPKEGILFLGVGTGGFLGGTSWI